MDGLAVPGVPVNDVQVMVVHGNFKDINRRREEFLRRPEYPPLPHGTLPKGFLAEKFRKSFEFFLRIFFHYLVKEFEFLYDFFVSHESSDVLSEHLPRD